MEWFKRLKQADPYVLLARAILVAALTSIFAAFFVIGIDYFNPGDGRGKKLALLNLVTGIFLLILHLATNSFRRQRGTDARLRGLAEYVEELRAYTVVGAD